MSNDLTRTLAALQSLAPLELAAPWDNVGLLLEARDARAPVERIALTIDLTEPVLAEARAWGAQLIVAYHPVIFSGLKHITRANATGRILLDAVEAGVAIYSPHTALDAVPGGVNDWLLDTVGPMDERAVVEPPPPAFAGTGPAGMGRTGRLSTPAPLPALSAHIKVGLGLTHVRVASAPAHASGSPIETVAVCPGAGGGLFESVGDVDLLLTGEMRHHDVLARVARGTSVILTDHTQCERGFLGGFAETLAGALSGEVEVRVSAVDGDPLVTV